MKKFILSFLAIFLIASNLQGNMTSQLPSFNVSKEYDKSVENKKKNYQDLINFLSQSSNGEYLFYLAVIYANGIDSPDDSGKKVKRDVEKSIYYFNKSVENGFYNAGAILGAFYLYHEAFMIVPDNIKKSKKVLQLALKNKVYESSTFLADIYFNYENNPKKGLELLFYGAKHNNAQAQIMLATLYQNGYIQGDFKLTKNEDMANEFLTMGCLNKNKTEQIKTFCEKYSEPIPKPTKKK